jgi:FdhD protein
VVRIVLAEGIPVRTGSLERNFYTTSSCGVCGKASLLALRSVAPTRRANTFHFSAALLSALPGKMREAQGTFERTGGLHAAALFDEHGELTMLREDVGRHNAVDKLVGASFLHDELPLRNRLLLLSGRISFELLQKAVMAGIPMVAAIGAPSSLAIQVAKDFDVTLVGFLRGDHFNVYNGGSRLTFASR